MPVDAPAPSNAPPGMAPGGGTGSQRKKPSVRNVIAGASARGKALLLSFSARLDASSGKISYTLLALALVAVPTALVASISPAMERESDMQDRLDEANERIEQLIHSGKLMYDEIEAFEDPYYLEEYAKDHYRFRRMTPEEVVAKAKKAAEIEAHRQAGIKAREEARAKRDTVKPASGATKPNPSATQPKPATGTTLPRPAAGTGPARPASGDSVSRPARPR